MGVLSAWLRGRPPAATATGLGSRLRNADDYGEALFRTCLEEQRAKSRAKPMSVQSQLGAEPWANWPGLSEKDRGPEKHVIAALMRLTL
jgi:hypothetical protein